MFPAIDYSDQIVTFQHSRSFKTVMSSLKGRNSQQQLMLAGPTASIRVSSFLDPRWRRTANFSLLLYPKEALTVFRMIIIDAVEFLNNYHWNFSGGDQGLLNSYFADWATKDISRRLPFIYNMTASGSYSYRPAYKQ